MRVYRMMLLIIFSFHGTVVLGISYSTGSTSDSLSTSKTNTLTSGEQILVKPYGTTDTTTYKVDSTFTGVSVDIGKTFVDTEQSSGTSGSTTGSGPLLFSLRHIKPDGTGKCKFGNIVGAWEKSPCAKIYGSRPIVSNSGSTGTTTTTTTTTSTSWSSADWTTNWDTAYRNEYTFSPDSSTETFYNANYLDR